MLGSKTSKGIVLPRGLWVGKQRKPGAQKRNLSEVPAGKRPWEVWPEDYFDDFYFEIGKEGFKKMKGTTHTQDYREAVKRARTKFDLVIAAKWDKTMEAHLHLTGKRQTCLLGKIFEAYKKGPKMTDDPGRIVQSCRLVVAMAKGWREVAEEGRKSQITEHSELAKRIDALPASVLCRETVKEYLRVSQGGEYQPMDRSRENITINKRLRMARQLFTGRALELCYEGVALPDVEGFMKFPGLPEPSIDLEEEMIPPEAYSEMLDAADKLAQGNDEERELALVNRLLRELGLRNSELLAARGTWLWQDPRSKRWYLDVRDRKEEDFRIKGAEPGRLPLSAELLELLGPRLIFDVATKQAAFLIKPEALPTHRFDFINRDHNAWLKPLVGEIRSGKGNHRLRKYVATMIAEECGITLASQYLRHASEAVSLKNYIAKRKEKLPVVTDAGLRAWSGAA